MRWQGLYRFAWKDFSSARLSAAVALVSVTIAVAAGVFFYGLSEGARQATFAKLEQSLSFNEIEVSPMYGVTLFRVTKEEITPLADDIVERLRAMPEVESVFPEIQVAQLSSMDIELFNTRFETDVPVYGMEAEALEPQFLETFTYEYYGGAEPVPVLVSSGLVDLYNSGLSDAIGKPKLNEQILVGQEFTIRLGYSSFFGVTQDNSRNVRGKIVGYSERVPLMGVTVPAGYVEDFNRILEREGGVEYSQLLVRLKDYRDVSKVQEEIRSWDLNAVSLLDKMEGVSDNLNYLIYVMGIISVVILLVSSLNVFTALYGAVRQKTKIIGTLRALGARRRDILVIYVLESWFIGALGGVVGVALGAGLAVILEVVVLSHLPFFGSAGVSLVHLNLGVFVWGILGSMLFTVVSGLYPALYGARLSPKEALQH